MNVARHFWDISPSQSLFLDRVHAEECKAEHFPAVLSSNYFLHKLSQATVPLFDREGQLIGNGVAIAKDLVLTAGHCVEGPQGVIGFGERSFLGRVVYDGVYGDKFEKLDFKILHVRGAHFNPVTLDVEPDFGESVQTYFRPDEYGMPCQYVKSLNSMEGPFATRSHMVSSRTYPGESGAPRMSMRNGYVHAIHQGAGEGLKVNDIYRDLAESVRNPSSPQQANAMRILQTIQVANVEMLGMMWSPLMIKPGDVDAEKGGRGVQGSVTVSAVRNGQNIEGDFRYFEERKGSREITIFQKGTENAQVTYKLDPDPHKNGNYKTKRNGVQGEQKFYRDLATQIGRDYLSRNAFPIYGRSFEVLGQEYTLLAR